MRIQIVVNPLPTNNKYLLLKLWSQKKKTESEIYSLIK